MDFTWGSELLTEVCQHLWCELLVFPMTPQLSVLMIQKPPSRSAPMLGWGQRAQGPRDCMVTRKQGNLKHGQRALPVARLQAHQSLPHSGTVSNSQSPVCAQKSNCSQVGTSSLVARANQQPPPSRWAFMFLIPSRLPLITTLCRAAIFS